MRRWRLRTPDLSRGAGPIVDLADAIVVPPASGLNGGYGLPSGVLRQDGRFVPESVTWQYRTALNVPPAPPPAGSLEPLAGAWVFMGPLFGHFGHVLVEGIARSWALDSLRDRIDGVVYIPRRNVRPDHYLQKHAPLLRVAGIDVPLRIAAAPLRVERLFVPPQGLGMGRMIEGSPELRDFVRRNAGRGIEPHGGARLYISRSALPISSQSILGETVLENYLRAEGYTIFHPEKHPLADQVAAYKAATHVIAPDGSPLHLLALVGQSNCKVAIIARRDGDYDLAFAAQLRALLGAEALALYHLSRRWLVEPSQAGPEKSWAEIDLPALHSSLAAAGMVDGRRPWPALPRHLIEEQVRRIEAEQGNPLVPTASITARPAPWKQLWTRARRRLA